MVEHLRNLYPLKWLRPRVVFSRHANLQEKLIGDLRWKVLWGLQMQTLVRHHLLARIYGIFGGKKIGSDELRTQLRMHKKAR